MLTNLNMVHRFDVTPTAGLLASGYTGTWVAHSATETIDLPSGAGVFALGVVWTESNRDGTVGFTPDSRTVALGGTGKLTVVWGKFRALTDQFSGTPAIGAALYVTTAGVLSTTEGSGVKVAYCTKASHSITHLNTSHTVIEYVTL
jgi:hypothetical protein